MSENEPLPDNPKEPVAPSPQLEPAGGEDAEVEQAETPTDARALPEAVAPVDIPLKSRKRGGCSRIVAGLIILLLAAAVGFLSTPYAGEALNRAEALWGNMLHGQSERRAGAALEQRGALVVYQTGTGNVESVNFQGRAVEPADLVPLLDLHRLLLLDLRNTQIADADLVYLKNLTNLATLVLSGTEITDEGLRHLAPLRNLEALHLTETAVSDEGLAHLAKLRQLAVLDLSNTEVTDDGLRHLVGLKQLRWLLLSGTKVSDEGLETLSQLKELRRLTLIDTRVTPAGRDRIEQAVPGIAVDL